MDIESVKSQWALYVAVGLFFLGIACCIIMLVRGIDISTSQRVEIPGSGEINLKETGKYKIYLEYISVIDGTEYRTRKIVNGLKCTLENMEDNKFVELENPSTNPEDTSSKMEEESMFEFEINRTGKYELNAWFEDRKEDEKTVLAVEKVESFKLMVITILKSIGVLIFFITLAICILNFFYKFQKG